MEKTARPAARLALSLFSAATCLACHAGTGVVSANAQVFSNCTVSTTPVTFGAYDPILTNKTNALNNGNGSVVVTCVKGSTPSIGLDLGGFASGSTRRMRHATTLTEFLTYELYQPPSTAPGQPCTFPAATVWGTTGTNLFSPAAAPNKNSRTFSVCGTVPAGQNVEVGDYSDTVTATVTF